MADINYIDTIGLGKVQAIENDKESNMDPITAPSQDAEEVITVDSLGVIKFITVTSKLIGNYNTMSDTIYLLESIIDGYQIATSKFYSPFVNGKSLGGVRRQGCLGVTSAGGSSLLTDITATFGTKGISGSAAYGYDYVKNLITGEIASVIGAVSETQLMLSRNIFPNKDTPYAVTAHITVKLVKCGHSPVIPGINQIKLKLSLIQSS